LRLQEVWVNRKPHKVKVLERNGNSFLVEINEKIVTAKFNSISQDRTVFLEINGKTFQANFERAQGRVLRVKIGGELFEIQSQLDIPRESIVKMQPLIAVVKKAAADFGTKKDAVAAPIAGRIVLLKAGVGQRIEKGRCICVLEAMKMQNEVATHKAGVIKEIRVSEGAVVNKGDILAVIA